MGRIARRKVHVRIPDDGRKYTFEAGEEVPDEFLQHITHPGVWIGEGDVNPENAVKPEEGGDGINDGLTPLNVRQLARLANDKGVPMPVNPKKQDLLDALRGAGVTSVG